MQRTQLNSWNNLEHYAHSINFNPLKKDYSIVSSLYFPYIKLDVSHPYINAHVIDLLIKLAYECKLPEKIDALINGALVNQNEHRPALHTALRSFNPAPLIVNQQDIMQDIFSTREKIKLISDQIRAGEWLGFSGQRITDIVNIGIGGSDLGPRFCIHALKDYSSKELNYHFISDADPSAFRNTLSTLSPKTTLFIIASKSFTTQETLYNAKKALAWIGEKNINKHFIAVTENITKAQEWGINTILPIWEWVGGRYSLCSAVNLITAIAIGFTQFTQLLTGANQMDKHFQFTPLINNLPVLLALLGVWNNNFLQVHTLLMLVYSEQLAPFVPYIQQLDMESNGKSIDTNGNTVNYATSPIIWGGLGNQAQHSYFQLLYQGTHRIVADLISIETLNDEMINQLLMKNKQILMHGVKAEKNEHEYIPGHIPLNHLHLLDCSPSTIGALIALYEHKTFVQSVIWNINSFDQPGVESAKKAFDSEQISLSY